MIFSAVKLDAQLMVCAEASFLSLKFVDAPTLSKGTIPNAVVRTHSILAVVLSSHALYAALLGNLAIAVSLNLRGMVIAEDRLRGAHAVFNSRISFASPNCRVRAADKRLGVDGGARHFSRLCYDLRCARPCGAHETRLTSGISSRQFFQRRTVEIYVSARSCT